MLRLRALVRQASRLSHPGPSSLAAFSTTAPAANRAPHPLLAFAAAGTAVAAAAGSSSLFSSCAPSSADGQSGAGQTVSPSLSGIAKRLDRVNRLIAAEKAVRRIEHKAFSSGTPLRASTAATTPEPVSVPLALCQIHVGANKAANLRAARAAVVDASNRGARVVSLPECFNSPYDTSCFPKYAEPIPSTTAELDAEASPSTAMLIATARECSIYLVGGSIPERGEDGKVYNTCVVVDPNGEIVARHRKMHLFDIDVPGKITFKESDTLSAGESFTTFDTPYGRVGVGICYDLRFPEQSMLMRAEDCKMLIFPGAFNMTTGPAHWELLLRARALDNQCFVAAVSPARDETAGYHAWGHSTVVSPWGEVVATTAHEPDTVFATVDLAQVEEIRTNIPVSKQKRSDLYELSKKKGGSKL